MTIEPCHLEDCIYPECSQEMGCPRRAEEERASASQFIGYFTMIGPQGYVEGPTPVSVRLFTEALLAKHGHALSGCIRKVWFEPRWRQKVWSRVELSGN